VAVSASVADLMANKIASTNLSSSKLIDYNVFLRQAEGQNKNLKSS
jgi:hypothetical protein